MNIGQRPSGGSYNFNGRIDDVRIYGRALTPTEIQTDMTTPLGRRRRGDPTPPTVAITAPANNAQVSDIVNVTADASDNVGVAGVQFFVDGVATGAEDTAAPYGLAWDTRAVSNGAHTLTARARDAAGNTTLSAPVTSTSPTRAPSRTRSSPPASTCRRASSSCPTGGCSSCELAGKIRVLPPPYTQPDPTPFLQLTNIGSAGVQQGIYDIALDPNFATNHYYYVFYTLGSPNRDRLSRFTANATLTGTVAGQRVRPLPGSRGRQRRAPRRRDQLRQRRQALLHDRRALHPSDAQDLTSPRGKIHRINTDGTIPTDNPFYDGAGPNVDSIWALGLRNPYRAYYDAPTGRLFIGDVGGNDDSTAKEEIDLGVRGANYGWPNCEGPCCSARARARSTRTPHNGRDAAITGGFVYHGTQFPAATRAATSSPTTRRTGSGG